MICINWLVVISIIFTLISISFTSEIDGEDSNKKLNSIETADQSTICKSEFDFCRSIPVIYLKSTKNLLLDFDSFNDTSNFVALFFPEYSSILKYLSWKLPLYDAGKLENVFKLKDYMNGVKRGLLIEIHGHDLNVNWVSCFHKISDYINVISTTFSQLAYLAARLEATENFNGKDLLYNSITEHLKVLAEFCSDLMFYSGKYGITVPIDRLIEPSLYFQNFLDLQENVKIHLSDKNSVEFVEFFFLIFSFVF